MVASGHLGVLAAVRRDIVRPGAMQRELEGISAKVLNQRLGKMLRFGILEKNVFPEVPPRVEYGLTAFGRKFIGIIDQIEMLQNELYVDWTGRGEMRGGRKATPARSPRH